MFVSEECQQERCARVSSKSVLQECLTRVTRLAYKSVLCWVGSILLFMMEALQERASTFGSLSAALDNIEAAMKRRQSDMEHLLKATEAAIARAWAGFVSRWASTMSYVVSTKSGDVLR